ncbi:LysE family translocator [Actinomadura litoris]|uniref:LysE family translocator n=1 Tax=Actinomadura litoris TaxID=2678616 RepID=UPI001FA7A9B7|nr:LysE family translocator [Actinomadura litoris]
MPGADTILVFRTSRAYGVRTGLTTAVGVVTGPVIWGALSGIGVALLIARNHAVYTLLALAGAAYLLYLAAGCFRAAVTGSTALADAHPAGTHPAGTHPAGTDPGTDGAPLERAEAGPSSPYVTGLLTNLLNPKIGVFYVSVMPGLFQKRPDLWVGGSLGLIQSSMGLLFLGGVALAAGRARRYLASRRASRVVEVLAGGCLLVFALYVVWSVLHSTPAVDATGP